MPITTYDDIDRTPLFVGQVATTDPFLPGRTAFNRSGAMMPFGVVVVHNPAAGSGPKDLILPNAPGLSVAGIVSISDIFEKVLGETVTAGGVSGYPNNHEVTYQVRCTIGVLVETAIAAVSDGVFFRHVATGTQQLGALRNDADGTNATALTNAKWMGTGAAGSIVPLAINLI